MLDLILSTEEKISLLDFGCGLAHLLDYISRQHIAGIEYAGLDMSEALLDVAKRKHQGVRFFQIDVLEQSDELPDFDYVVMNGLFTSRGKTDFETMFDYWGRLLKAVFPHCRKGLAFNATTKIVDWERDDLFHLPFDRMADYIAHELSRHFVVRHDYGLYEYTVYVYREHTYA